MIAKSLSPSGSDVFVGGHGSLVLTRGILIPLLSVVLILAGPLAMLRYPRYSTVLDGATFAAASASAFVAAEVIVQALSALGHGLRPPGSVVPWLVQLALIAVALPLVTMASMAAIGRRHVAEAPRADQGPAARSADSDRCIVRAARSAPLFLVVSAVVQITLPSGVALAIVAVARGARAAVAAAGDPRRACSRRRC